LRLDAYDNRGFCRGRSIWIEALWLLAQSIFIRSQMPGSAHRVLILRMFGARIGSGVKIKSGVRVKFPWRLAIGDHSWIGEDVWIDNLADVEIGAHCCISQGVYLCTGNHNWALVGFDLRIAPVRICNGVWVAARAVIAPGATIGEGGVLTLGAVATHSLPPWSISAGNPAKPISMRSRPSSPLSTIHS
jgi:putative colanic acid biosynthesis acetyltransferase WcaF